MSTDIDNVIASCKISVPARQTPPQSPQLARKHMNQLLKLKGERWSESLTAEVPYNDSNKSSMLEPPELF